MMKLLIGGSPCTHWSIAQTKNRETEPSGIGWELFKNYLVALEKYKPDFFLYENNKSMSAAIREQITKELGVEPIEINSALVSAQSRKRLYWTNIPGVGQPEDKGILLRDILETGVVWREKAYTLRASIGVHGGHSSVLKTIMEPGKFSFNGVAEPVRIGTIESDAKNADFDSQQYRVYSPDGDAADQFQALNDAMNALAQGEELEPITPDIAEKAPRPHPCPASGKLRPPKSTRTAYAARVQRIRPQARSTIRQRRNRRRE